VRCLCLFDMEENNEKEQQTSKISQSPWENSDDPETNA
jgi:hypothetical protein